MGISKYSGKMGSVIEIFIIPLQNTRYYLLQKYFLHLSWKDLFIVHWSFYVFKSTKKIKTFGHIQSLLIFQENKVAYKVTLFALWV